jgi:hypothetical protein
MAGKILPGYLKKKKITIPIRKAKSIDCWMVAAGLVRGLLTGRLVEMFRTGRNAQVPGFPDYP